MNIWVGRGMTHPLSSSRDQSNSNRPRRARHPGRTPIYAGADRRPSVIRQLALRRMLHRNSTPIILAGPMRAPAAVFACCDNRGLSLTAITAVRRRRQGERHAADTRRRVVKQQLARRAHAVDWLITWADRPDEPSAAACAGSKHWSNFKSAGARGEEWRKLLASIPTRPCVKEFCGEPR